MRKIGPKFGIVERNSEIFERPRQDDDFEAQQLMRSDKRKATEQEVKRIQDEQVERQRLAKQADKVRKLEIGRSILKDVDAHTEEQRKQR